MPEKERIWQPEPDFAHVRLRGDAIEASVIGGFQQRLVSGDIDRFVRQFGLGHSIGALGIASGGRYAVRMARDRLLAVGVSAEDVADGWHEDGFAVTTMTSALRVIEFRGTGIGELLARATVIDPGDPGPCAAIQFAGVTASAYFYGDEQTLRVHFDRGLAAYMWDWLQCQPLMSKIEDQPA